jgi:uncharacterized protein (TIGR02996 family)
MGAKAFLQAIAETPDDDAPRLVYADWLEEYGTSEADRARAELIRAQCRAAALPPGDSARKKLEATARTLLRKHGKQWRQGLPRWAAGATYERGFLRSVTASIEHFIRGAEALFAVEPVTSLDVGNNFTNQTHGEALAACPHLANLTRLRVVNGTMGDEGAEALAEAPHLAKLVSLDLENSDIGSAGVAALADSPHLANLEVLDLFNNRLREPAGRALAASPYLKKITSLQLGANWRWGAAGQALRERFGDAVRL